MYFGSLTYHYQKTGERFFLKMTLRHFGFGHTVEKIATSKTPYVAIDERGLVNSIHLFLFSCVH